ncbi:MAG: hypothetical protein JXR75_08890 [Rhodobacteraceae bacterium]|nr:hypothetical protein [Paracoccaceae bacterium]
MTIGKKTARLASGCAAALLMTTVAASAATYLDTVSGGNDPFPDPLFEGQALESPALAKCDEGVDGALSSTCSTWVDGKASGDYASAFTLTYYLVDDEYSFDWTFDPTKVTGANSVLYPAYVAVKQSTFYDIWKLGPGESLGGTIASGLAAISHVSSYDTGAPSTVPLPAAG